MANRTLADFVTESTLEELVGDRYFERGLVYFRHSAVSRLRTGEKEISARVRGTRPYAVRLWLDGRELRWECTCPLGRDGEFCKHLVATGLAWLAGGEDDADQTPTELQTIREFLDAADKQTLVDLLVERASEDDDFAGQLVLSAQRAGHAAPGALKETIRKAFSSSGFVGYGEMRNFASRAMPIPVWAEEGRRAFPNDLNYPLEDFLVAEYHRRKRHDDAIALRWARFSSHSSLQGYQQLKQAADKAKAWTSWREKALSTLRPAQAQAAKPRHLGDWIEPKSAVLIQILLWEGAPQAALEQARAAGCSVHLWLDIARALEKKMRPTPSPFIRNRSTRSSSGLITMPTMRPRNS